MSLINDALKRANQTQKGSSLPTASGPAMQPAPTETKSKTPLIIGLGIALVAPIGLSAWLFAQWSREHNQHTPTPVLVQTPLPAAPTSTNRAVPTKTETNHIVTAPAPSVAKPQPTAAPTLATTRPVPAPTPTPTFVAPQTTPQTRPAAPIQTTVTSPAPVKPAVTPNVSTAEPQTKPFPVIRLKAIIYSETSPKVMIDDKTYSLGDDVEGARIIKIERRRVTLKWNGQEKTFALQ
jgi:hypothetical protein